MTIGAIIQARTTSTRFPGKVLHTLPYNSSTTILQQVIGKIQRVTSIDTIIVATTTNTSDDPIVEIAHNEGTSAFRGSEDNVLERYMHAAKSASLDTIVRITSDCPCIDPQTTSQIIKEHLSSGADYTSNTIERTFPRGLDTEVFSMSALRDAYSNATEAYEKEHVTPYIYKTNAHNYKIHSVRANDALHASDIRLTVDTKEDYALLCTLFDYGSTTVPDILALLKEKPWLQYINGSVQQKPLTLSCKEVV